MPGGELGDEDLSCPSRVGTWKSMFHTVPRLPGRSASHRS